MVARNRLVISGYLGSPQVERWSVSVHYALAGGGAILDPVGLQTWATRAAGVLDAGETPYNDLAGLLSTVGGADRVDIYGYGPTGPAIATANASCAFSGGGTLRAPFDTAVAFSLNTDRAGRSYRGRIFWPGLGVLVGTNGRWNATFDHAVDMANLLQALGNTDGTVTAQLQVYSPTRNEVTPVTSVRVGNVTDSQRRRRESLTETYVQANITP